MLTKIAGVLGKTKPFWKHLIDGTRKGRSPVAKGMETALDYTVGYPMYGLERAGDAVFGSVLSGVTKVGAGVGRGVGYLGAKTVFNAKDLSSPLASHMWKNKWGYGGAAGTAIVAGAIQRNAPNATYHTPIQVHNVTGRASSDIGFSSHTLDSYYAR